jgi:hypothetical protein
MPNGDRALCKRVASSSRYRHCPVEVDDPAHSSVWKMSFKFL